jgi:hypothetical protein
VRHIEILPLPDQPFELFHKQVLVSSSDAQCRCRLAQKGRREVENAHCVQETAPRLGTLPREASKHRTS